MKAALRVLTALSERQEPDSADVDELHWYAPSDRERSIDELACDAIQRALQDRNEKRKAVRAERREKTFAFGAEHEAQAGASATARPEPDSRVELIRQARERREQYRALTARLRRLGIALQQAAEAGAGSAETTRDVLDSVAGEADLSGIAQLLFEQALLARQLLEDERALKKLGVQ